MFKKLNNTTLLIILLVLLAVYFVSRQTVNKERSFKNVLTDFDKSQVEKIIYTTPEEPAINIKKEADGWIVTHQDKTYQSDTARIMSMLEQISNMQTKSIAAKRPEKWNEYEVSDSAGVFVEVYGQNDNKLADFTVGKFSYQQQQQQAAGQQPNVDMTSYIRLQGDDVVYGVDGYLKMAFPADVNQWRDKTLVQADPSEIDYIRFRGKESFSLNRSGEQWMLDDRPADSAKMQQYLNSLQQYRGQGITEQEPEGEPAMTCEIERQNKDAINVEAWPLTADDEEPQFLVKSDLNPDVVFAMPENALQNLFRPREEFLPED